MFTSLRTPKNAKKRQYSAFDQVEDFEHDDPNDDDDDLDELLNSERERGFGYLFARFRYDPGWRLTVLLGLISLVVLAVAVWWVMLSPRNDERLDMNPQYTPGALAAAHQQSVVGAEPTLSASDGGKSTSDTNPQTDVSGSQVAVAVVGQVRRPGLVRVSNGSRVQDAINAAGGPVTAQSVGYLNVARKVSDGEMIVVGPVPSNIVMDNQSNSAEQNTGGNQTSGLMGQGKSGPTSGKVNLNTADTAELDSLPGVGPVLAQHIVDHRRDHGRFVSVEQLNDVSGIGEAKFADLQSKVTV